MPGILEEIDIYDLNHCPTFYPSISSDINDLIRSIKEKGLLHPITIRAKYSEGGGEKQKHFEIVAGNRRYMACKYLGWRKILCHIVELTDKEAFEISLVENIQRRTLNPIEEAYAFKIYVTDFGWGGVSDLAVKIGKSASYVGRRLGLLHLPEDVRKKIIKSSLNSSVAEELLPIHNEEEQSKLADLISKKRLSTKHVRKLVKECQNSIYAVKDNGAAIPRDDISEIDRIAHRSLDKSIIALRLAMIKIIDIMYTIEDNWIIYEILLQHRNALHNQIDILIKEKKKL
jgi:ParB family chromosome partitioning protein